MEATSDEHSAVVSQIHLYDQIQVPGRQRGFGASRTTNRCDSFMSSNEQSYHYEVYGYPGGRGLRQETRGEKEGVIQ